MMVLSVIMILILDRDDDTYEIMMTTLILMR